MKLTPITHETPSLEIRIAEGSDSHNGGHIVEVTIIREGTSNNGNHYGGQLLRDSAQLFEGARAFADHQAPRDSGQPRSVRDLVGHYRNPRFELTPKGGRIRADLHVLPGQDWLWGIIQEAERHPDICGLSIDAKGEVKPAEVGGRQVRMVEALRKINSIDVVSRPAAGGSLDRILAGEEDEEIQHGDTETQRNTECPSCGGTGFQGEWHGMDATEHRLNHLAPWPPCPTCNGSGHLAENHSVSSAPPRLRVEESATAAQMPGISDERPAMESEARTANSEQLTAAERQKFATITRTKPGQPDEYKFPIPPKGHPSAESHARNTLARIDQSDLTPDEKETVRAKAHAVLGTPDPKPATRNPQPAAPPTQMNAKEESMNGSTAPAPVATAVATENPIPTTPLVEGTQPESLDAQLKSLLAERDTNARELAAIKEALSPSPAAAADPTATAVQLLEQLKHERDVEKSTRLLEARLRESNLPAPIQARLRRRYDGKVFGESQLNEDIADERDVLGSLSSSGQVMGHGYEKPLTVGMSEYEQLQAAFDKMFDVAESDSAKAVPAFKGLRDAFAISTGRDIANIGGCDLPLMESYATGLRNYVNSKAAAGLLTEAEMLLREADVTTSTFSYLLGTSMNKRLLKDYQAWPSEWQKFTNVVAVKDFKQQDRIRLGAFGSLSTVAEDAAYTTLTLSDTHATYTPTKRGNLVQISRETIINDDLYAIKQIPQKLAVAAAFTLAEFVYSLVDPGFGNIYDAHPLFDSVNHVNTGVTSGNLSTKNSGTALSSAAMQTAVIAMRKQQNAASKPIGLKPRFLLTVPDLEFTAMTILKSAGLPGGANNDINPMMGYAEPIIAPQLNALTNDTTSTTIAMAIADPRVIDTLEIGFIGGQVNPVLFIQDQPLYGLNFTQDVISYKVRHEYGGAVVDYRGFYLINN